MREEHQERLFKLDGGKYVERPESEMDFTGQAGTANGPIRSKVASSQLETEKIAEAGIPDEADTAKAAEAQSAPAVDMPHKEYGFIAVSSGEGMNEIFSNLGVDEIISGGQTMNPSTDDILAAVGRVNADTVFVLPNNKNIILAANQAASLTEDKRVIVIPAKTLPQGISALISFMPSETPEDNEAAMTEAIEGVKTGEVTYSVRDTEIDGFIIKEHDIMGIGDKGILAVGTEILDTTFEMIYRMVDADSSLISIYYGEDINESEASVLKVKVEEEFPDLEIELHEGGEPVYYYIVSVE